MRQRWSLPVLLLLVGTLVGARSAAALCVMPETPCREFERTPIVFQGRVESVAIVEHQDEYFGATGGRLWRVKVERAWKGLKDQAEARLLTRGVPGKTWVEDEFEFKLGERYVIWAWPGAAAPDILQTNHCSLTRPLKDAREELAFLDSLSRPAAGGYIYGRVSRADDPWGADPRASAGGLTVALEGGGRRRETRSDSEGRFRFAGLQEGHYEVILVLPATLAPFRQSPADPHEPRTEAPTRVSVDINGPRDCASAAFLVESTR